jgi:tetratricopeptide (TPR) repeat protein
MSASMLLFTGLGFESVWASDNCDKARVVFSKGRVGVTLDESPAYYLESIRLCPGYIRPYELLGNHFRQKNENEKAIEFFLKAADLGTTNHKLYYLLADMMLKRGDVDGADKFVRQALTLRGDYAKSLALKTKILRAKDNSGPKIILFEPAQRRGIIIAMQSETTTVRGLATDKSDILWVKINQKEIPFDERGNFIKEVSVNIGENVLLIEAADKLGNISSMSVMVEGQKTTHPPMAKGELGIEPKSLYRKSFAVVIGVNNYEKWSSLEFAVADARAIEQALSAIGFDEVTLITDKAATQRRILSELFYELPRKVTREDRVMFYFAGHGQTEDLPGGGKRGYIIPVDGETSDYPKTAISMAQIRSLSNRIVAKHILYVMDSCYSGLGLSRSFGLSPKLGGYLQKVAAMRVVQIITAGGMGEQVQEREGHGLFTSYFLKALEGAADIDKDSVVTGTEIGAYLRPAVSNASGQVQTPLYGRLEGEGEFIFVVKK